MRTMPTATQPTYHPEPCHRRTAVLATNPGSHFGQNRDDLERSGIYPNLFLNAPCSLKTRNTLNLGLLPDHEDTLVRVSNPNADKGSKANEANHIQLLGTASRPGTAVVKMTSRPSPSCEGHPLHGCGHTWLHYWGPGPLGGVRQQRARSWEVG